ncbi:MAG: hypothetical protein F6K54_07165 [Okeania sp. SIO3B5]|uniref:hypothetical protein n=1 Tax=Okeania sp. SIO3B5 TaxID=2607811 RepID=UPI0014011579|nr:hypothetical protein [Okeania sp. SIO3B5]NEO52880.1 hypothetical protein [Okeania sp. SIO3B5]
MENQINVSFIGTGTMGCPIIFQLLDKSEWNRVNERDQKTTEAATAAGVKTVIEKV